MDRKKNDLLFGKRETESWQIASLTKIMTATVVLDLIEEFEKKSNFARLQSQV